MIIKALNTLSDNEKTYISKGREYEVVKSYLGKYFILDNYGESLTLTEEEVRYKFETVEK